MYIILDLIVDIPIALQNRLTKAGIELAQIITSWQKPVVTPYEVFFAYRKLFGLNKRLYLKSSIPEVSGCNRLRNKLVQARFLLSDENYHNRAYKIATEGASTADEVCCCVDPFCYVSHMSAMQRYGLTNRRPDALHLTRPDRETLKRLIKEKMIADYGGKIPNNTDEVMPLNSIGHPKIVRGRKVHVIHTKQFGENIRIRGTHTRASTIGQTFLDTLMEPQLCGGMSHVIEVWLDHAPMYQQEIIDTINMSTSPISKLRAGYILEERLGIRHQAIDEWVKHAVRGSSRVLDPEKPFEQNHSERWMLSINV